MRVVRLVLALILIVQAVTGSGMLFALLGGFLLFQAAFNYGCCGANTCDINHDGGKPRSLPETGDETTFEEVE